MSTVESPKRPRPPRQLRDTGYNGLRRLAERRDRADAKAKALTAEFAEAESELLARLGLSGQEGVFEPSVLDELARVRVDGAHWQWLGIFNNKGLPVVCEVRTDGRRVKTEWSAAQWLHLALVDDHYAPPNMRSICGDRACVRLEHRCKFCAVAGQAC